MGRRSKHTREFWARAVAEVDSGRMTRRQVAERCGVGVRTLDYWRSKLGKTGPKLVRVVVGGRATEAGASPALAELVIGDVALRFTDQMPARYVAELVRQLRGG
jgi:transposase-like protein